MVALVSNVFLCNFPSFDTSLPSSNNCQREFFKCWNIFLLSNDQFFIIYNFTYIFVSIHLYMALIIPNIVCNCDPVLQIVLYNTIFLNLYHTPTHPPQACGGEFSISIKFTFCRILICLPYITSKSSSFLYIQFTKIIIIMFTCFTMIL